MQINYQCNHNHNVLTKRKQQQIENLQKHDIVKRKSSPRQLVREQRQPEGQLSSIQKVWHWHHWHLHRQPTKKKTCVWSLVKFTWFLEFYFSRFIDWYKSSFWKIWSERPPATKVSANKKAKTDCHNACLSTHQGKEWRFPSGTILAESNKFQGPSGSAQRITKNLWAKFESNTTSLTKFHRLWNVEQKPSGMLKAVTGALLHPHS